VTKIRFLRWPLIVVSVILLAGCDWSQFMFSAAHTGFNPSETTIGVSNASRLRQKWAATTQGPVGSPVVVGGTAYVGSFDQKVYAFDAASGALRWSTAVGGYVTTAAAVEGGRVFVMSGANTLTALNAATGAVLWSVPWGFSNQSPTVGGGRVYVPGSITGLTAFDAATGNAVWHTGLDVQEAFPGSAAYADGTVYVAGTHLWAFDAATGAIRWTSTEPAHSVASSPSVANGRVYVGSNSDGVTGNVVAFDAATGARDWTTPVNNTVLATPAVTGGSVFVGTMGGNHVNAILYALDATTGAVQWTVDLGDGSQVSASSAVANGVLYDGGGGGLELRNAATGALLKAPALTCNGNPSSPAVVDGTVYVGACSDNLLHAYRVRGT
jgi:outer membrane protein assembly factor BamB